jgi:competence protein ComEC
LEELIEETRHPFVRGLRRVGRAVFVAYGVTLVLGLAVMPLTAARYHLVAPVGILIGPPAVALASVALVAGFLQLVAAAIVPFATTLIAPVTQLSLAALSGLVEWADAIPYGHYYIAQVSLPWLVGFYALLAAALWLPAARIRPIACAAAGLAWLIVGLAVAFHRDVPAGLRVTFLAVGHGGCTVLETPDGRVLVCDAGSMAGPEVTRRVIAPYLWHRGISRVDEVFLTHADLDHFNGLPALLERFTIGQVSLTPSFAAKPAPGVQEVLEHLSRRGVSVRVISAGDRLVAGDVSIDVFHPPAEGPSGPENARSLVLAVRHAGNTLVLTGDLDLEGRPHLMSLPRMDIDVWMAPHHGGRMANPPELAAWARPGLVVAHNGFLEGETAARVYESMGCRFVGTWPHGAIILFSSPYGLTAETFRSRERILLRESAGPVVAARGT